MGEELEVGTCRPRVGMELGSNAEPRSGSSAKVTRVSGGGGRGDAWGTSPSFPDTPSGTAA
eukprot:1242769-Amphidinium_carterae.1